jgi:HD-GYP domain-containing protein (c-di-GMP phosphodiesterase class II)
MLRVRMSEAEPGMVLAMPIYHPKRHGTVLLKAGITLEERTIARLEEIRLPDVWIEYPRLEELEGYLSPDTLHAQAEVAAQVGRSFDDLLQSAGSGFDYGTFRESISRLIDRVIAEPKAALYLEEMLRHGHPALKHACNVCILSVLMGLKLEDYLVAQRTRLRAWNARDVSDLGVGAMYHDVGMLALAPEVLERFRQTRDQTDHEWQKHVVDGWERVREMVGPAAASAVLHHHQHFDGTGFPRKRTLDGSLVPVKGADIHVFARIVACADLVESLRYPHRESLDTDGPGNPSDPDPASMSIAAALGTLRRKPYSDWIDPIIFKSLIAILPPYPPGTIVKLNSGVSGVVVAWTPLNPCRPVVKKIALERASDRRLWDLQEEGERFDLTERTDLAVVEAEGVDVSADNFYPDEPLEFCLDTARRRLFNRADHLSEGEETPPYGATG